MPPLVEPPASAPGPSPAGSSIPTPSHPLTLSSGGVFGVSLLVQLLGVVGSIFLYKQMLGVAGAAIIGTAQFFLLIGSSINGVGDLRLGTAYTYFLARGKPPTDNTSTYFVVRLAMVSSAGLLLFVIAPLSIAGHQIASGPAEMTSLGIFLALPVLWSFSTVYNSMFIGLGNSLKAQYPSLVEALVRLPVLFYVAYHVRSVEGITVAYAVGAAASALFSLPALRPKFRSFRRAEARRLFRFAWPLMASLMLNYMVTNMVPLIVNAGLGHTELSIFLAANGWRVLVLSLPLAVTTPLFPYLAGLHQRGDHEAVRRGTWQALRFASMLLVPGVVAVVTYRYTFLNTFSNKLYATGGALPLAILVAGAIPLALSQIIQSSINAIGRQRLELYITSTQVVVLFAAVFALMPPWGIVRLFPGQYGGIVAGSVAVLLSSCAALALNTYFMETLIRVHIDPRSILRITFSAAVSFASLSFINRGRPFPVTDGIQLLAAVVIGFVVYFLVLAGVGELTRDDIRRIGASMSLPSGFLSLLGRLCWNAAPPDLAPVALARAPGFASTELPEPFTGTTELPPLAQVPSDGGSEAGSGEKRRLP
ncbi:MAG TPA: polysaccharide biosynthesis C-terminal domain-containing protein [Thermoplasmata archaeon]|nr:polysaccharide biosynthesis C-terminal domain-containing protein [Thermoplasmata archaeon]